MAGKSVIDWIAFVLVIASAVNRGLVGSFDLDVFGKVFGGYPILIKIVYILVGLSGLYLIYHLTKKK